MRRSSAAAEFTVRKALSCHRFESISHMKLILKIQLFSIMSLPALEFLNFETYLESALPERAARSKFHYKLRLCTPPVNRLRFFRMSCWQKDSFFLSEKYCYQKSLPMMNTAGLHVSRHGHKGGSWPVIWRTERTHLANLFFYSFSLT